MPTSTPGFTNPVHLNSSQLKRRNHIQARNSRLTRNAEVFKLPRGLHDISQIMSPEEEKRWWNFRAEMSAVRTQQQISRDGRHGYELRRAFEASLSASSSV